MYADVTEVRTNLRWPRRTSGWRVAGRETVIGLSGNVKDAALPMLSCRDGHDKVINFTIKVGSTNIQKQRQCSYKQCEAAATFHEAAAKTLCVLQVYASKIAFRCLANSSTDSSLEFFASLGVWQGLCWQGSKRLWMYLLHQRHLCFSLSKCLDLLGHSSQLLCIEQHVAGA